MDDRPTPIRRTLRSIAIASGLCILIPTSAYGDVFGRLHFSVKDADTEKPVSAVKVTLHDTAGVRADITLTTTPQGDVLSPPLENHAWQIATGADTFETDTRTVNVAADTTTEVEVLLEPQKEKVIKITGQRQLIRPSQTSDTTRRDQDFIQKYPATAGNPQSLPQLLTVNPGFVPSTVNVVHPRGEHASTSIYINGFQLPGVLQGRAGPQISPDIIQSADIQTGGYAPEYGSETAAILNLTLRSGTIKPFQNYSFDAGTYKTLDQALTFGGQGGAPVTSGLEGPSPLRFRYLVSLTNRSTDNALEPPQPDNQTAHNHGISATLFGNFEYVSSPKDQFSLLLNSAPAHTQVANRTGLPDEYAPVGQGFGYGGARNADGTEPGADPTLVGGQTLQIASQEGAKQDIYQTDDNNFGALNYRHAFSDTLTGLLSLGLTHSGLDIKNNNPSIDPNAFNPDGTLATIDNSIEYNPTILRSSNQKELSGSLTQSKGTHTYKAGFTLTSQTGDEYYQFISQSQLALDSLGAVQAGGPQLTPDGAYEFETNENGTQHLDSDGNPIPVLDALGNQVYLAKPGASTPIVRVHRSGYYNAAYLQDTWRASHALTINYGLRLDMYHQTQSLATDSVNSTSLSPRFNASYAFDPSLVGRLSYDKLFTQPPLAQGAILGTNLVPQTTDQYEASLERQFGSNQTVKAAYYYKNLHNEIDTGILIPYTQIGAYTTLQYTSQGVHGFELSYDLTPHNNVGMGGFIAYTNSIAKPNGVDQTGAAAPIVNDHDQLNTVSAGVSYTFPSTAFAGVDVLYGSGEASSVLAPIGPSNSNVLNGGLRNEHTQVNLRIGHPKLTPYFGLEMDVENLMDDRTVLNFNSGFSGTRFQQGRRILLRAMGNF